MKTWKLICICIQGFGLKLSAEGTITLHGFRDAFVDVDLLKLQGVEEDIHRQNWVGRPAIDPMYRIGYAVHFAGRETIGSLSGPVGVSFVMVQHLGVESHANRSHGGPTFKISALLCAKLAFADADKKILSKLVPSSGYARYVAKFDGTVLGDFLLPAGEAVDEITLTVPGNAKTWTANREQLEGLFVKFGLNGPIGRGVPKSDQTEDKIFHDFDNLLREINARSPLEITVISKPKEIFETEPLSFDVKITNRGIPSYGFYLSSDVAIDPQAYHWQFQLGSVKRELGVNRPIIPRDSCVSLKYLESRTLTFNALSDFGRDLTTPGLQNIQWNGVFFTRLDHFGIDERLNFDVSVVPLPVEKLKTETNLDLLSKPNSALSVASLESEKKRLHLLIKRTAGKATRVLRLGEHSGDGNWTLAYDSKTQAAHILFTSANGSQTYWTTQAQLTGINPPDVFSDRKLRSLKTAVDGVVAITDGE